MRDVKIVVGASFGDEGKGLMTDYFAADAMKRGKTALVVCSNGGAQRGHTVKLKCAEENAYVANITPEIRHVFHHFGSGTFVGAATYLPRFFIVNPMLFVNEYLELSDKLEAFRGCEMCDAYTQDFPKVYIHPQCFISTPYDMILNQILEESRGNARHGSCGMGIWETLVRSGKCYDEVLQMKDEQIFEYIIKDCKNHLWKRLQEKGITKIRDEWREIIDDEGIVEHYIQDFRFMNSVCETIDVDIFEEYDRIIFENGQGLLLDRCRREYGNNTTPSNTGFRNPAALLREYDCWKKEQETAWIDNKRLGQDKSRNDSNKADGLINVEVCYVSRTYLTRHGAGRFDEQCDKSEINPDMVDMTNVPNPHQGTMRYGKLDEKALIRRIREDFDSERLPERYRAKRKLAVTHINEYTNDIIKKADYISDGETRITITLTTQK